MLLARASRLFACIVLIPINKKWHFICSDVLTAAMGVADTRPRGGAVRLLVSERTYVVCSAIIYSLICVVVVELI